MVKARLFETARQAFFFASPRHFEFVTCETKTLRRFKCERETRRLLNSSRKSLNKGHCVFFLVFLMLLLAFWPASAN